MAKTNVGDILVNGLGLDANQTFYNANNDLKGLSDVFYFKLEGMTKYAILGSTLEEYEIVNEVETETIQTVICEDKVNVTKNTKGLSEIEVTVNKDELASVGMYLASVQGEAKINIELIRVCYAINDENAQTPPSPDEIFAIQYPATSALVGGLKHQNCKITIKFTLNLEGAENYGLAKITVDPANSRLADIAFIKTKSMVNASTGTAKNLKMK